jgi:hypothetical protein
MAETPETNKPDFRNGFPIRDLRDGSLSSFSYSVSKGIGRKPRRTRGRRRVDEERNRG